MASISDYREQVTDFTSKLYEGNEELSECKELTRPIIRAVLDDWMDLRLQVANKRAVIRASLHDALKDYELRYAQLVANTSQFDLAQGQYHSAEERASYYKMQLFKEFSLVEAAKHILELLTDFLWDLDKLYNHWDNRRVDLKWEIDRISQISSSDYES